MPEQPKPLPVSSSVPPRFAAEQENLFRAVLLINERKVPYAVSGAFALHEHTGIWRDTKDLDVFMAADQVERTLEILQEHGFKTEITDPVWLCKVRQGEYYVDLISGMSNAVIRVDQNRGWIADSILNCSAYQPDPRVSPNSTVHLGSGLAET